MDLLGFRLSALQSCVSYHLAPVPPIKRRNCDQKSSCQCRDSNPPPSNRLAKNSSLLFTKRPTLSKIFEITFSSPLMTVSFLTKFAQSLKCVFNVSACLCFVLRGRASALGLSWSGSLFPGFGSFGPLVFFPTYYFDN